MNLKLDELTKRRVTENHRKDSEAGCRKRQYEYHAASDYRMYREREYMPIFRLSSLMSQGIC